MRDIKAILQYLCLLLLIVVNTPLLGQDEDKFIKTYIAADTILDGNAFEFKIVIRNMKGDFTPPALGDFDIVRGPNISSSMQFINGKMFRESSYSYYLRSRKSGEVYIEESYLDINGEVLETQAIPVLVLDNPEELQVEYKLQSGTAGEDFVKEVILPNGIKKKNSKRKLKKI